MKWVFFFTTVLAYQGAPTSQFGVVALGISMGCVMAFGKYPSAIGRGRTSPGAQIYLGGIFPTPYLLVFWEDITQDACVHQKAIKPACLSIVNGQMKHPGSSESGKANGGLFQAVTALYAGLASFHGLWVWLDVLYSSSLEANSLGRLLVRILPRILCPGCGFNSRKDSCWGLSRVKTHIL